MTVNQTGHYYGFAEIFDFDSGNFSASSLFVPTATIFVLSIAIAPFYRFGGNRQKIIGGKNFHNSTGFFVILSNFDNVLELRKHKI
jgi:hypothetical protein